jgi:hypothetical protein
MSASGRRPGRSRAGRRRPCRRAISTAARTRSTAETRPVRSSVTPAATTAALPPVSAISSTAPEPIRSLCASIRPGKVLAVHAGPASARGTGRRHLLRFGRRGAAAAHRQLLRSCATSFSSRLRSSISASTRQHLAGLRVLLQRQVRHAAILRAQIMAKAACPVSASIRRTPAEDALSPRPRPDPDVAGLPHMGAAAKLDRIGRASRPLPEPVSVPIDTTRTSSPYFSPNSACAPAPRVVGRHDPRLDGRVLADEVVHLRLDRASSSALIALPWLKSKRSRSGAFSEPRCAT